ncbi:P-loop NTPase fold protein [Phenylobacterium sp. LjRoot225]|uniref:P-loop NTPase fold protein n=1 Tax=Phenylobacterium sp. LjRoot225 TaxID=3342285 RepID=UPI003ECD6730
MTDTTSSAQDPNRHVRDYLEHYLDLTTPPHYAVLLDGPWGIGKTYLVRQILDQRFHDQQTWAYLSLYGLTSVEEIDRALAHALFPFLGGKTRMVAEHATKAVASFFRIKTELSLEDIVNTGNALVYVFDDLERCDMPMNKALGYINALVEHDGKKVIVIANEAAIQDEAYGGIREKLIGKTLVLRSVFEGALDSFVGDLRDKAARDFLTRRRDLVRQLYSQSHLDNLRILQQGLWEFERVFRVLDEHHRTNAEAMDAVLMLILAYSFEVRAGRLKAEHLRDRFARRVALMSPPKEGGSSSMAEATARYPDVDLFDRVLDDETLHAILGQGLVDRDQVHRSLDQSIHFRPEAEEPEWVVLFDFTQRPDEDVEKALTIIERRFADRSYERSGEVLHVFGLRLWDAVEGRNPTQNIETVLEECRAYLRDLLAQGRIEPIPPHDSDPPSGYAGMTFKAIDVPEFQALSAELHALRLKATQASHPAQADDLLGQMAKSPTLFAQEITLSYGNAPRFYDVPILASASHDRFLRIFAGLDVEGQGAVLGALATRYRNGRLFSDLKAERAWVEALTNALERYATGLSPAGAFRIRKLVAWRLTPHLAANGTH